MRRVTRLLGRVVLVAAAFLSAHAHAGSPAPLRVERVSPPDRHFFSKRILDQKIPILAHADVPDAALQAAATTLDKMLAHAPRLAANLRGRSLEIEIAGKSQLISDLPPFHLLRGTLANGEDFDEHTRGKGHSGSNVVACSEGNLLGYTNDRAFGHDICVHELAHGVMWLGMSPSLRGRVVAAFAKSRPKWASVYAGTNSAEWFAELSMWYFGSSSQQAPVADSKPGPKWLASYDPDGYALLDGIFTDQIDPGVSGLGAVTPLPAQREASLRSVDWKLPVTLTLHNGTTGPLALYWLDYSGARKTREAFPAGADHTFYTYATHAFLVAEPDDRAREIYVVPDHDAAATVQP